MRLRLPQSLQARFLLLSLVAIAAALLIAGWTMAGILGRLVTQGLDRRLDAEITLLATTIGPDGRIDRPLLAQRAAALEAGPGWRWRIDSPSGTVGAEDLAPLPLPGPDARDREAPPRPPGPPEGFSPIDASEQGGETIHARQLTVHTSSGPVILTAAAPRAVVLRPVRDALAPLLATLGALAVVLVVATLAQLRWGLRPLRRLGDEVAAIRAGTRTRVDEDQPTELMPLAAELNQLAADNAAALVAARLSAANLAHALKTPVAALGLAVRDDPDRATQVARLDATIRHHLARARLESVDRRAVTPLASAVADLIGAVQQLHSGRSVRFSADVAPALTVMVDPHDLDEMLGNLLDNAARHARSAVSIAAMPSPNDGRLARIVVADNGPGIAAADRDRAVAPGRRLDERGDGHGFGLAIVGDLAALYGGSMALDDAPAGGLLVTLVLPMARPA